MKIAFVVTHPRLGQTVLVRPNQTIQQAIEQHDRDFYGEVVGGEDHPVTFPLNPRWYPVFSKTLLASFCGLVTQLRDPDSFEQIPLSEYRANYDRYVAEREKPFPLEDVQ